MKLRIFKYYILIPINLGVFTMQASTIAPEKPRYWYLELFDKPETDIGPEDFRTEVRTMIENHQDPAGTAHQMALEAANMRAGRNAEAVVVTTNLDRAKKNLENLMSRGLKMTPEFKRAFELLTESCTTWGRRDQWLTQIREKLLIVWEVATEKALSRVICPSGQVEDEPITPEEHAEQDERLFGQYLDLVKDLPRL